MKISPSVFPTYTRVGVVAREVRGYLVGIVVVWRGK